MTQPPDHSVNDDQAGEGPAPVASKAMLADRSMLEILICPVTRTLLRYDYERQELISEAARLAFPIRGGVPVLVVDEARHF
jgi:uncharacterized protein YbaR (Trm112 family)